MPCDFIVAPCAAVSVVRLRSTRRSYSLFSVIADVWIFHLACAWERVLAKWDVSARDERAPTWTNQGRNVHAYGKSIRVSALLKMCLRVHFIFSASRSVDRAVLRLYLLARPPSTFTLPPSPARLLRIRHAGPSPSGATHDFASALVRCIPRVGTVCGRHVGVQPDGPFYNFA